MKTKPSERLAELLERKEALLVLGERLRKLAVGANDPTSAQVLDDFLERFRRTRFLVLVVGDFKAGKSTLVNALIGRRLCPVKATPRTAKVTRVSSTSEPTGPEQVEITYIKDRPVQRVALGETNLEDLVAVKGVSTDAVQLVDVYINPGASLLRFPIRLVDTPGLGSSEKEHSAITSDYVRHADVVLFVFTASKPMSEPERAFLLMNRVLLDRVVFVVNQIDRVEGEEEDVLDYLREGLGRDVLPTDSPPAKLFPVSGRKALEASTHGASGMPELVTAIEAHLADRPFIGLLRSITEQQGQVCAALHGQASMAQGALSTASRSADALRPALVDLRRDLQQQSQEHLTINADATRRIGNLQERLGELTGQLREQVVKRVRQWVLACTEAECKDGLPSFLARDLTNAVQFLDDKFNIDTAAISEGTLRSCGELFRNMELRARAVLIPAAAVGTSGGHVGRGVAALSGLSAFAEQMGTPEGGYGAATAAVQAALGPSTEVRLLSLGAAVSLIVAALGGPVSWIFVGAASLIATFFGWRHSTGWRERVIARVTDKVDSEILPNVEAALQQSLATFAATLGSEVSERSAAVLARLLGIVDTVARDIERVGLERESERARLDQQLADLAAVTAELNSFAEPAAPPKAAEL